jgi:hypothetical protein
VNVVAVPSTIDTGFALPPIEEFEKKSQKKQEQSLSVTRETLQDTFTPVKNFRNLLKLL